MATRCQIGFYRKEPKTDKDLDNHEALLYQHYDGYPENVIRKIMPVLKDFDEHTGLSDIEYASAWLIARLKTDYLSMGISKNFHFDIQYYYAVYKEGVKVYEASWDDEGPDTKPNIKFILIARHLFSDQSDECEHEWHCMKCGATMDSDGGIIR